MRPEKVDAVRCPCCDVLLRTDDPDYLAHGLEPVGSAWRCDECGEVYDDQDEAEACCL